MIRSLLAPLLTISAVLGLAAGPAPALAGTSSAFVAGELAHASDPVAAFDEAARKLDTLWSDLPFQLRHVTIVAEEAPVFGAYRARASATFRPGDTVVTYMEPVGYSFQPAPDGFVRFGVVLDFEVILPNGDVAAGKKNFLSYTASSRARMKELMLNTSLHLDEDFPDGTYTLHYVVHDPNSGKSSDVSLPFKVQRQA